ncbi:hypothetical protein TNCV_5053651 [Trichonephila clavipes]|nr:hypothetical protein TNCV_5053651 [Trichonephila clavipes]
MSRKETESPDFNHGCTERRKIYPEIEGLDLVTSRCLELINYPDTDDNQEMKAILVDLSNPALIAPSVFSPNR